MRKVILYIATSLDGCIARKDDSIDWLPAISDEDYGFDPFFAGIDTVIMGYKTYEVSNNLGDWPYPGKEAFVFSRNDRVLMHGAQLIHKDPAAFVAELKKQPGKDIWLVGGGSIFSQLHNAGLVDEYVITLIPVLLGNAISLFPDLQREEHLELNSCKAFGNGSVMLQLRRKS